MFYTDLNQIRGRLNHIADIINASTNYGRRALPEKYLALQREYDALMEIFMKPALLKNGVEIEDVRHD